MMRTHVKFVVVFQLTLSLMALPLVGQHLPRFVPPVWANKAPVESWYPSGPAMDYVVPIIYTDESAEFNDLASRNLDLTDTPLRSSNLPTYLADANYYVATALGSISGIDFNMVNNFWGCDFNFGNPTCGIDIRQGIAHLVDKVVFSTNEPTLSGNLIPVDDPAGAAVPEPNPCNWDTTHVQTGSNCVVGEGGSGGVAYHLNTASQDGGPGTIFRWTPSLGSPDFCAAADHFKAAGLASGMDGRTCQLKGIAGQVGGFPVEIFVRSDNQALNNLGNSVAEGICALFTGTFSAGCSPFLTVVPGSFDAFPGYTGLPGLPNKNWWIYTSGAGSYDAPDAISDGLAHFQSLGNPGNPSTGPDLIDVSHDLVDSVYSALSEGGPFSHTQCPSNISTYTPTNYGSICNPAYDNVAKAILDAPCASASGDPAKGQVTPTFGYCPGTSQYSLISNGYKAEDIFGKSVYAIPVFIPKANLAYLSNWQRVINGRAGIFNYFSWLDAYSPNPAQTQPGPTVRQGFSQAPNSLNPYTAETPWDLAMVRAIYDSPGVTNPLRADQNLDWMTVSTQILTNGQLAYTPPAGTIQTYRFSLRNDIFWPTGQKLTAWDAKFSYTTLHQNNTVFGSLLSQMACNCPDGIRVLSPTQFDVSLKEFGVGTPALLTSIPIIPGRYWSVCTPATWDTAAATSNFQAADKVLETCMQVSKSSSGVPDKATPSFDPLASGVLVGSGPWVCKSSGGTIGLACSSTGTQIVAPGGTFTLTRYGQGSTPGGSLVSYFRSNGNLALWIWSGDTGDFNHDFLNSGVVSLCVGQPLLPLGSTGGCGHWQQGIGAPAGHSTVGLTQVGIVQRFVGVDWVSPYDWVSAPPQGLASFAPVLYEGISTGNAGNPFPAGASQTLNPASRVGCGSAYPAGGYDC